MHIFHKWGKWQVTYEGEFYRGLGEKRRVTGRGYIQEKQCEICGLKKFRKDIVE